MEVTKDDTDATVAKKVGNVKQLNDAEQLNSVLKVDHTHGGILYKKGTDVAKLKAHPSAVDYMREHGVL